VGRGIFKGKATGKEIATRITLRLVANQTRVDGGGEFSDNAYDGIQRTRFLAIGQVLLISSGGGKKGGDLEWEFKIGKR